MPRPYGKFHRGGSKLPAAPQVTEIQVNMRERYTMEQLALDMQRALAMVQDFGAFGVEELRLRLLPLDVEGKPMILRDGEGHPVTVINIPEKPREPIYREDEPGVGVLAHSRHQLSAAKGQVREQRGGTTTPK